VTDIQEMDQGVVKAREGVINCLRVNDRRPLDCWEEVETFKREVRRVEIGWVEKVVR
jgi:altered-inheritance-of-mitochondria protein 13